MNSTHLDSFFKYAEEELSDKSDVEKIQLFIKWCRDNGLEEVVLRLSSEEKGGWSNNYLVDFTTTRILVTKKNTIKKFIDMGYVAGMAPIPYAILARNKKLKLDDMKRQPVIPVTNNINNIDSCFSINYSDISRCSVRKGTETTVRNMLGTMIKTNFLRIDTKYGKVFNFTLPTSKNGDIEKVFFWLHAVIPVCVMV